MNSALSLPIPVAVFLRRLVNVFSGLSISHQYLSLRRSQEEGEPVTGLAQTYTVREGGRSRILDDILDVLQHTNWSWWTHRDEWSRLWTLLHSSTLNGDGIISSEPPIGRGWNWRSFLSFSSQSDGGSGDSPKQSETDREPSKDQNDAKKPSPPLPYKPKSTRDDPIHRLLKNPVLYDPLRAPRHPIVLCHGLYGFDVRGPSAWPSLQMHYWANVLNILKRKVGADVIVTAVPSTGSITSRAENLDRILCERGRGRGLNLMGHSMGGLDCRYLISHIKPTEYTPLSLTTLSTPHRGSPFMDWCANRIGLGRLNEGFPPNALSPSNPQPSEASSETAEKPPPPPSSTLSFSSIPSSFTTFLISILDSPAYANLTSTYLNTVFNPATPDSPNVRYFSVAGRSPSVPIWHPFWLPKMVLDEFEDKARQDMRKEGERLLKLQGLTVDDLIKHNGQPPMWEREDDWGNDGLVTIQSARWGEFMGIMEGCDHWEIRGARGIELDIDLPSVSFGIGSSTGDKDGDGWSISDWTKFVKAWRKEEKKAQDEMRREENTRRQATEVRSHDSISTVVPKDDKKAARDAADAEREAVLKSSTDKLSAVFDWLVEQVPVGSLASQSKGKGEGKSEEASKKSRKPVRNELETKEDLERFYVALSRKLYDEGL
ncbi:hypothetical protein JAAARDRAFT_65899 [Jaapia argillacea MUCL 33604]|uniref:DUF676 domain-containing protein n=1 Tax=Jaapia argillacea MUCL 33604 TaxID=933084 RepID=A0A067QEZ7_9AGAM|nr:hypothetical protein JAAARDRAFT_65899 [Jaapia argillacea MUCL 33604]